MQCYCILNSSNLLQYNVVPSKCSLGQAIWAQSPEPHGEYYLCESEQVHHSEPVPRSPERPAVCSEGERV